MGADPVLVTGGAGFIGSHLVDRLVSEGREVRVLDVGEPQVHQGSQGFRNPDATYVSGSILSHDTVASALRGISGVVHLAAQVGVGQSMYEIERYVRENSLGTAILLEEIRRRTRGLSSLLVASSMSIYGEGQYACDRCGTDDAGVIRTHDALQARQWEPLCRRCSNHVRPKATAESKRTEPASVYAVTKRDHEELCLVFGRAYGVRTVALRFFNVYGPRQSLANPYTGVAAIFAARLLNRRPPQMFEDGLQTRDFVHVSDIVEALVLALDTQTVGDIALNVGTGVATSVHDIARVLASELDCPLEAVVVDRFRHGDIRHCFADISCARALLRYEPAMSLQEGMRDLTRWIRLSAASARDETSRATAELSRLGLVV